MIIYIASYLNSLVPQVNEVAIVQAIDNLRNRADGKTIVDMEKEFMNIIIQIFSVVCIYNSM